MAATPASGGSKPGGKAPPTAAGGCPEDPCVKVPKSVLVVAFMWMAVLVALFFLYERDAVFKQWVTFKLGRLPFEAIWFGAAGGFLISAQGIFEHNREWRRSYDYWHYARPLLGALIGTLGCLVFLVLNEAATKGKISTNPVFYDVIALAIGYREESFRALIAKLFDTIILPGKDETKPAKPSAPASGPDNTSGGGKPGGGDGKADSGGGAGDAGGAASPQPAVQTTAVAPSPAGPPAVPPPAPAR